MIIDGNDEQASSGDRGVTEHSREGGDDLASEAKPLLDVLDQARGSYRDHVKESPAVARSTFAEEVGMAVNALRGKLEDRDEDELAEELRWDLDADDFDAEIDRVRAVVERVAEGAGEESAAEEEREEEAEEKEQTEEVEEANPDV